MINNISIKIPERFNFNDLNFKTSGNGALEYSHKVLNDLLITNGQFLPMLSSKLIQDIIVTLYKNHLNKGGQVNRYAEQLLSDQEFLKKENAVRAINIRIPDEFYYLQLDLKLLDNGEIEYNKDILNHVLMRNGSSIDHYNPNEQLGIIYSLYLDYFDKHKQRDKQSDLVFGFNDFAKQVRQHHKDAIVKTPSAIEIKALRERTGLSQSETAELLGLSGRQLISDYEREVKTPSDQIYTLWLILTNQHPDLEVMAKKR